VELGGLLPLIQYDVLAINGTAQLGGWLNASLINGYVPDLNNPLAFFTVLSYTSVPRSASIGMRSWPRRWSAWA
jgi:hypothetical protein